MTYLDRGTVTDRAPPKRRKHRFLIESRQMTAPLPPEAAFAYRDAANDGLRASVTTVCLSSRGK